MTEPSEDRSIQVSPSRLDLPALVATFGSDPAFMHQLEKASVLIVPSDLGTEYEGPAFPHTTRDVFQHLQNGLPKDATVDATVRDDAYVEFDYHSEDIILPSLFVAKEILLPFVISLLAAYVNQRSGLKHDRKNLGRVTSIIHFRRPDGEQLLLKYNGPSDTYEQVALEALRSLGIAYEEKEQQRGTDNAS